MLSILVLECRAQYIKQAPGQVVHVANMVTLTSIENHLLYDGVALFLLVRVQLPVRLRLQIVDDVYNVLLDSLNNYLLLLQSGMLCLQLGNAHLVAS